MKLENRIKKTAKKLEECNFNIVDTRQLMVDTIYHICKAHGGTLELDKYIDHYLKK